MKEVLKNLKNKNKAIAVTIGVLSTLSLFFLGMHISYTNGFFDAVEKDVGASECRPLRKLAKVRDFK